MEFIVIQIKHSVTTTPSNTGQKIEMNKIKTYVIIGATLIAHSYCKKQKIVGFD